MIFLLVVVIVIGVPIALTAVWWVSCWSLVILIYTLEVLTTGDISCVKELVAKVWRG